MSPIIIGFIIVIALVSLYAIWQVGRLRASLKENFDTYRNHDYGAQEILSGDTPHPALRSELPSTPKPPLNTNEAARLVAYSWAERDRRGNQIYDEYYNNLLNDNNCGELSINPNAPIDKIPAVNNPLAASKYSLADMIDFYPAMAYDWHSDEYSYVSQKNY